MKEQKRRATFQQTKRQAPAFAQGMEAPIKWLATHKPSIPEVHMQTE